MKDAGPEADGQLRKRRGLRLWHFMLLASGVCVLCLLLGLAWVVGRDSSASARVSARLDALRSSGLPVDDQSLSTYYDSMATTANVDQWMKLLELLKSPAFEKSAQAIYPWLDDQEAIADGAKSWPGERDAIDFLKQWTDVRKLAHNLAIQDAKVRLPIRFDGVKTDMSAMNQMRQLARLFQLESLVAIRSRNSSATRESILCILGTSRSIEAQPVMVSQLVCLAIESVALEQIKKAVEHDVLGERDLKMVLDRLQSRSSWSSRWQVAINGDRASTLPVFRDPSSQIGEMSPIGWDVQLPWRSSGELAYLEFIEKAADLPQNDLTEFTEQARALEQTFAKQQQESNLLTKLENSLFYMVTPSSGSLADAFVLGELRMRIAIIALGLRKYQKQFKRFPESLDQLAEIGLATDQLKPIGNKPFGYRNVNGQVTLWGFRIQAATSTPDQPPEVTEENPSSEMWVWTLK